MKMKNLDLKLNEENIHYVLKNNFINRNRYISSFLKLMDLKKIKLLQNGDQEKLGLLSQQNI